MSHKMHPYEKTAWAILLITFVALMFYAVKVGDRRSFPAIRETPHDDK